MPAVLLFAFSHPVHQTAAGLRAALRSVTGVTRLRSHDAQSVFQKTGVFIAMAGCAPADTPRKAHLLAHSTPVTTPPNTAL